MSHSCIFWILDSQVLELYKHGSGRLLNPKVCSQQYLLQLVLSPLQPAAVWLLHRSPSSQDVSPLPLLHRSPASISAKQDNERLVKVTLGACTRPQISLSGPSGSAQDHGRKVRQNRRRQRSPCADPTLRLQKWIKHVSSKAAAQSGVAGQNIKIARTRFPK